MHVIFGTVGPKQDDGFGVTDEAGNRYKLDPALGLDEGQKVAFSVRRDGAKLADGKAAHDNAIEGEIRNIEYQGTFVKVALKTCQKDEFLVYLTDGEYFARPRSVGETVLAVWPIARNHYLAGENNSSGDPTGH